MSIAIDKTFICFVIINQCVAEVERFELSRPVKSLRAFQARPFSLLGRPP